MDAELFGYNNLVNIAIDYPVRWLGPRHRIMYHTKKEAYLIGYFIDGWRGAIGGLNHIILDSAAKNTVNQLEWLAYYYFMHIRSSEPSIKVKWDKESREWLDSLIEPKKRFKVLDIKKVQEMEVRVEKASSIEELMSLIEQLLRLFFP